LAVNWNATGCAVLVRGSSGVVATIKALADSAGSTVAVESGIAAAAISVVAAIVTAAVLVARFAACGLAAVVSPAATMSVHATPVVSLAPAAVNTTVAVVCPWLSTAVHVVVPQHPVVTVSVPLVPAKSGSTRVTLSPTARSVSTPNLYDTVASVCVSGGEMVNSLPVMYCAPWATAERLQSSNVLNIAHRPA
jgi:hypothetical protein